MSTTTRPPDTGETIRTRREFLRASLIGLAVPAAGTALAACSTGEAEAPQAQAVPAHSNHSGGTTSPHPAAPLSARQKSEEMDRMHEAGIRAFPAKTEGKGNQLLQPRLENGVKVYELTTSKIQWETEPGKRTEAWAYNGHVPGPQIRVREGDHVRVVLQNQLDQSTASHFHGLELPFEQDGVPFVTQPPVRPGESYTYEFTVPLGNSGSHMYHSHSNSAEQVGKGLLGAFIVEPKRPRKIEKVDVDYFMILNDGFHGYTINGKGFPATEPIMAKLGQKVRIRFMNEGMMIHPMHLHGMHMTVIDKDGWAQPAPWRCDTLNIARRAVGRDRQLQQPRHLDLPLPRPPARGRGARHVRHGHRPDRGVTT